MVEYLQSRSDGKIVIRSVGHLHEVKKLWVNPRMKYPVSIVISGANNLGNRILSNQLSPSVTKTFHGDSIFEQICTIQISVSRELFDSAYLGYQRPNWPFSIEVIFGEPGLRQKFALMISWGRCGFSIFTQRFSVCSISRVLFKSEESL